jgi:hypothetical protein
MPTDNCDGALEISQKALVTADLVLYPGKGDNDENRWPYLLMPPLESHDRHMIVT